jgi:hypothetical protein
MNDLNIWERSPLLESLIDGVHDIMNHNFIVNGQPFPKLYYLVDGIYPILAGFVPTISDPSTKLDQQFTAKQESIQTSVERTFGVIKKFLSLSSRMRFNDWEDIFYVVKGGVVMHYMMVEEQFESDKIKSKEHYFDLSANDLNLNEQQPISTDENNVEPLPMTDYSFKYQLVTKKWKELLNIGDAIKLQDALKRHLFKSWYGNDGSIDCEAISDNIDHLTF